MNSSATNPAFILRIVMKFADQLHIPYGSPAAINAFFTTTRIIGPSPLPAQFPGSRIDKLFTTLQPEQITALVTKACESDAEYISVDLKSWFVFQCPAEFYTDELLQLLNESENIELAYLENSPANPPFANNGDASPQQGYLNAAPAGIDAQYAWKIKGGKGNAVKFIDIEQGWMPAHVAVAVKPSSYFGINHYLFQDHGTAVLGIIMMQDKQTGLTGITPKTKGGIISQWRPDGSFNNPDAILSAISLLDPGDILLLESQSYDSAGSTKAWPVEIEEATFQVIRLATAIGIIVIEAAGNGNRATNTGNDLDLLQINGKHILNPASPHYRDSGAIIVAAASSHTPHSRINCTNYGKRVNCFAWGEHVATAGYFPGSSGAAINTYTRKFCGTSSAAAIIAGAAISLQSIVSENNIPRLTPKQMRNFLGSIGTSSANGKNTDKIGVMPDLQKIIRHILPTSNLIEQIE